MDMMKLNGFTARIMEADRLVGDTVFGLPPGRPLPVYKVSEFVKKSEAWIDDEGSFVVPVNPDKGLWFDWTQNDPRNTAVLPSVKGCNPITGQQIDGFVLESYQKKCPVHGTDLNDDLYCDECGYKLAPQNYVCAPNILWWDGFRDKDGTVRQFFFTEDMKRDVAAAMLGKENTVPAFGFAFYTAKEKRLSVKVNDDGTFTSLSSPKLDDMWFGNSLGMAHKLSKGATPGISTTLCDMSEVNYSCNISSDTLGFVDTQSNSRGILRSKGGVGASMDSFEDSITMYRGPGPDGVESVQVYNVQLDEPKEVAVGAGAQIEQNIERDSYAIESWKDEPDAVMRIYFVFEDEFNQYASHGLKGENGSMLNGVPVG